MRNKKQLLAAGFCLLLAALIVGVTWQTLSQRLAHSSDTLAVRAEHLSNQIINLYPDIQGTVGRINQICRETNQDLELQDPERKSYRDEATAHQLEDEVILPRFPQLRSEVNALEQLEAKADAYRQELTQVMTSLQEQRQSGNINDSVWLPLSYKVRTAEECAHQYEEDFTTVKERMKTFEIIAEKHRQRTPKCDKFD